MKTHKRGPKKSGETPKGRGKKAHGTKGHGTSKGRRMPAGRGPWLSRLISSRGLMLAAGAGLGAMATRLGTRR